MTLFCCILKFAGTENPVSSPFSSLLSQNQDCSPRKPRFSDLRKTGRNALTLCPESSHTPSAQFKIRWKGLQAVSQQKPSLTLGCGPARNDTKSRRFGGVRRKAAGTPNIRKLFPPCTFTSPERRLHKKGNDLQKDGITKLTFRGLSLVSPVAWTRESDEERLHFGNSTFGRIERSPSSEPRRSTEASHGRVGAKSNEKLLCDEIPSPSVHRKLIHFKSA